MNPDKKQKYRIMQLAVICIAVIMAGVAAMNAMAKMKRPPEEKQILEKAIRVETLEAAKQDIQVSISAFGEVAALNTVDISPEVSGLVTEVHPRLEEGEVIPEGEVLFKIDATDYQTELQTYTRRYKAMESNMKLAEKEYRRVKKLYEKSNTGTLSDVESARNAWNTAIDNVAQLEKLLRDTRKNLERCTVRAPFYARVKGVNLEKGQFVSGGGSVLSIADDSVLEVAVPVDTSEALMVLDFEEAPGTAGRLSWFGRLKPTGCRVVWAESGNRIAAAGYLHRVVKYDAASRTVYLAVRIDQSRGGNRNNSSFPVVEGMFCEVVIPGKTITGLVRVPDSAVSYDGKVKIASNGRLKTVPVQVAWKEGGYSLVSAGLENGDKVITTRLSSPLENSLLEVSETAMLADGSGEE